MRKRRRPTGKPQIDDRSSSKGRGAPALPFGFPFVKPCYPVCPPSPGSQCMPLSQGMCQPGYPYYPTACLPTYACLPNTPTGCLPNTPTGCLPTTPTGCLPTTPTGCLPTTPTGCLPTTPTGCLPRPCGPV